MTLNRDAHIDRGREIRRSFMNTEYLSLQLTLRIALAQHGWYEFIEPEEGENTAIGHESDFETYILGHITDKAVILDPGDDYVQVHADDYNTAEEFVAAFKIEFDRLVKVWFPE